MKKLLYLLKWIFKSLEERKSYHLVEMILLKSQGMESIPIDYKNPIVNQFESKIKILTLLVSL